MIDQITVTAENLEVARESVSTSDQAAELKVGCETWGFLTNGQRCQMTVWPNGRGAVSWGADSQWGDWNAEARTLLLDSGETVTEEG